MDAGFLIAIVLALLLLGVIWSTRRSGAAGTGALVGRWLALTLLVLWVGLMFAFVGVHALLFALGTGAAAVGFGLTALFIVATPVVCAALVRRRDHSAAHHG